MRAVPTRSAVAISDTWDLQRLYVDEAAWDRDFGRFEREIKKYGSFKGRLGHSVADMASALSFDSKASRLADRLGAYAYLRAAEDQTRGSSQRLLGRFQSVATRAGELSSFMRPEIVGLPTTKARQYLAAKELARFRMPLQRMLRYKPHTLSDPEERLLAMQGEMAQAAARGFRQLLDADLKFGQVPDETGRKADLTHATYRQFLQSSRREVRKAAFQQYYAQFIGHENTFAALLAGTVQRDVYYARVRGFGSSLEAALFPDQVPVSVYRNLIAAVRKRLPVLFRYLDLRRRKLKLKQLHAYDLDAPLFAEQRRRRTWDQAVSAIEASLAPLGKEYIETLVGGLRGRWCDRYPNQGKQSGAFSYGTYDGDPYILMNYKPEVLDDVFTLAHEAGHSMHSHYSVRSQPYETHDYAIFVAEVASTFNEQLLSQHLLQEARSEDERAVLLSREIDGIRATIIRQTMFAEFELQIHEAVEGGEPLTVEKLRGMYGSLLRDYFGPEMVIDEALDREGMRIPHFYRAFYVYKYATGLSAAIALSQQVLREGPSAAQRYVGFLQSGSSKDPLDLLRDAGVDMEQPQPIVTALQHMETLVKELESLL